MLRYFSNSVFGILDSGTSNDSKEQIETLGSGWKTQNKTKNTNNKTFI